MSLLLLFGGSGGETPAVTTAQWVWAVTVRGVRCFPHRGQIVVIEFGHVESTDYTLDTEGP